MLTFWGVVTVVTVVGGLPAVGGLWIFERWRSRARNTRGACATCGTEWAEVGSGDPFLIHGRLVCEPCAVEARRRMPWQFAILGLAAGGAALGAGWVEGFAAIVLLPVVSTAAMTLGAVQLMKLANRRAQRRIAMGEYPAMGALAAGPSREAAEE